MRKLLAVFFLLLGQPAYAGITCVLPYNLQNNTTADANQVMANYNALVTCFLSAAASGVNSDITALLALATPITPSQGGTPVYFGGTSGGTANAQSVATLSPAGFTLLAGKRATFIAGFTNTGATTLALNGLAAKDVYRTGPLGVQVLHGGEIIAGNVTEVIYDGTQYQLLTSQAQFGGMGPLTNLASSSTTDLGTVPSHNINITGNTTITAFGSSAQNAYPVYNLTFAGAMLLTYNATSLILPSVANIMTAAGDTATALYLSSGNWQVISYTRATGVAVVNSTPLCGANGLVITNNVSTPNTSIDITAGSAVLVNPTGNVPLYTTAVSVTINETTTGVNGLDTGALANNTFYHHYLISNGSTIAGLSSTSATAPAMPTGYTFLCRLGASKTNGAAVHYGFRQSGAVNQYKVGGANLAALPPISVATAGTNCTTTTPTWLAVSVRAASGVFPVVVPPTATDIQVSAFSGGASDFFSAAPNSSYGGIGSATDNQPPLGHSTPAADNTAAAVTGWMKLEADTIAVCNIESVRIGILAVAWRDAVNAN